MELIKIKHPYNEEDIVDENIVLILGFFDGVHSAHQKVIKEGVRIAKERGLTPALMTFNRSPKVVYRKFDANDYTYLTQPSQKYALIEKLGVEVTYEVFYNSGFGRLGPQEFVDDYIVGWNAQVVVAGYDYTYGKPGIASMRHLPDYAKDRFDIVEVGEKKTADTSTSSTAIREYIKAGEIQKANNMLGYNYETLGFVVHGDARGRKLGFPTANVRSHPHSLLPDVGVYAVWFTVHGKRYMGMASIGYNVTFKARKNMTVEVNVLDFDKEIYGDDVKIEWVSYLRGQEKYEGAEALIKQLEEDERETRHLLEKKK